MNDILPQITKRIEDMPKVSDTPYRLLRAVSNKDFNVQDVIEIVETDVSLTTRCLKIVNSAAYGLRQQVSSIKQAVILLGSEALVNIALAQAFRNIFTTSMKGYSADKFDFWKHSVRTAIAAKVIAQEKFATVPPDLVYTAGLMHDVGKAIISEFLEKYHSDLILKLEDKKNYGFLEIERDLLGTDHTLVGEAMAQKWRFPEALQYAIRYHHDPNKCKPEFQLLAGIIHVGDLLAMMGGTGTGIDSLHYTLDKIFEKKLELSKEDLDRMVFEIDLKFIKIQNKMNRVIGEPND